jgi:hypothetical protein
MNVKISLFSTVNYMVREKQATIASTFQLCVCDSDRERERDMQSGKDEETARVSTYYGQATSRRGVYNYRWQEGVNYTHAHYAVT